MTRRKTRTLPSSDESPKTTRRSSRKRNDDDSPHSEENDKANYLSKNASTGRQPASKSAELAAAAKEAADPSPRSKRGRHATPPPPPTDATNSTASTRRSLRRPAPSGSAEDEEMPVPPLKKLRGRAAASTSASSNNNSPPAAASTAALAAAESDSGDGVKDAVTTTTTTTSSTTTTIANDLKGEKYVRNSTAENDNDANATSVPTTRQQQQKPAERAKKRRLAEPNEDDAAFVTNDSESNCVNNDGENDAECKMRPSGKLAKEEASKRRKVSAAVSQKINAEKRTEADNGLEKGDRNHDDGDSSKAHVQANGIEEPIDDWSGWSEGSTDEKESPIHRVWMPAPNSDSTKENIQFSILSYNILAESLLKNSHYFKNISPSHWNQQHRHRLLMKELGVIDADIFCLQEVERQYFQSSLSKELSSLGYEAIFACSETPGREEGVALCFRNSRFRLVAEKSFALARIADQLIEELNIPLENKTAIADYVNEPQMLQCALLECCRSAKRICVSNIHVSYAKHMKPDLRCAQIARTMWEAATLVASHRGTDGQEQNIPLILCGDLNSTPESPVYQLCRDGYLNDAMLNRLQQVQNIKFPSSEASVSLVNVLWKAFQHPVGNVRSSYYEVYNREPPLTQNLKGNKGCLDYVWFTRSGLAVAAALPPRCSAIKGLEDTMPNAEFPSDHLSLAVRFAFP